MFLAVFAYVQSHSEEWKMSRCIVPLHLGIARQGILAILALESVHIFEAADASAQSLAEDPSPPPKRASKWAKQAATEVA